MSGQLKETINFTTKSLLYTRNERENIRKILVNESIIAAQHGHVNKLSQEE